MKTEIKFKIDDLNEVVSLAAEAREVLLGLAKHNLFEENDYSSGAVADARDLAREVLKYVPQNDALNDLHRQLAFGHDCAVALWKLNIYHGIKDVYSLPKVNLKDPEQYRTVIAQESFIQRAVSSRFGDYND